MPLLEGSDLHVDFFSRGQVRPAVKGVSFSLEAGEILAVESGVEGAVQVQDEMKLVVFSLDVRQSLDERGAGKRVCLSGGEVGVQGADDGGGRQDMEYFHCVNL